ncbi:riboflavin synthase subunit alpha [Pseudooceanicola sp. CBS1P-1]|uniref:Riboflavin synthase n=1 Tax=Pseudooceanicola albus TaxID=2692189 RepID=A0A6L7G3F4_9RHOB|nr:MULTISPECIES: riboflavin synthase subunit alpha [Pseudooceanicola]MBT9385062.1 riboflavin synthase subunit alpha [Pseudooceanicola endophyticus]MXN18645.1 riboflavin synthase subunit alpha [Pseudooceanicola albus]
MYTGIVQTVASVASVTEHKGFRSFVIDIDPDHLEDLKIGGSVAIEGVCLSATVIEGSKVSFDAMTMTLERTNLSRLAPGMAVNVERSAKMSDENGGHPIAGHISCTAEIVALKTEEDGAFLRFRVPAEWSKYIFDRGFIAINGASLTVAEAEGQEFTVYLIPETLRQTTFRDYQPGDHVNIEVDHQTKVTVDVMERTLERLMPQYLGGR